VLDLRIYRAAFVAVLLAALVVAFSLQPRPRPIGTTLAPDAFDGAAAFATLTTYADASPDRRPGSSGDDRLAQQVARDLDVLGPGAVRSYHATSQTIDGPQDLTTVVASRPGRPGPGLVVVAHRDAVAGPAQAELSGTAALVQLARVAAAGRLRRTITFVSTSGASGGLAGAREAVRHLPRPVDAVLVLGDLASRGVRKPWVTSASNGGGSAPLRLSRTVESAVRATTGQDPGGARAPAQWARLALPMTLGEQGAFGEAGLPAVLLSASGERPPPAGAATSEKRLTAFGRAALRAVFALDNGPDVVAGPRDVLVTQRKILPRWAVTLLVGAALLPFWLAVGDGAARARRRRLPVAAGVRRTLVSALLFALVLGFAYVLGLVGMLPARPGAPAPAGAVPADGSATGVLVALVLLAILAWVGLRPLALRLGGGTQEPLGTGHAAGTLLVLASLTVVVWLTNPFAAALLVLPAHAWLLAVAPDVRSPRPVRAAFALLALLPVLAVVTSLGGQLGYGPLEGLWNWVLMVAGGHVGVFAGIAWAVAVGVAAGVAELVARVVREEPGTGRAAPVAAVRGPQSYAGPGSLGGTDSALRR
jgi:hypothetical protein